MRIKYYDEVGEKKDGIGSFKVGEVYLQGMAKFLVVRGTLGLDLPFEHRFALMNLSHNIVDGSSLEYWEGQLEDGNIKLIGHMVEGEIIPLKTDAEKQKVKAKNEIEIGKIYKYYKEEYFAVEITEFDIGFAMFNFAESKIDTSSEGFWKEELKLGNLKLVGEVVKDEN
jgi:hypothetical protein